MMRLRSEGLDVWCALCRLAVIGLALALAACSILHRGASPKASASSQSSAEASAQAEAIPEGVPSEVAPAASASAEGSPGAEATPAAPGATVDLTYAHRGDYLASLSVSKFNGAELVASRNVDAQHAASTIRFDGGVPVWEIKADTGVFTKLPVLGSGQKFAVKSVTYGKLPKHFAQTIPDSGPPEPLETGHYYIFTAQRATGTLSYEAVRVEPDGSLDGYEAEPRAGTSYMLCCNVNPDFVQPTAPVIPEGSSSSP
jgi:hypothetical protein